MSVHSQLELEQLNDEYIRAFLESDIAWFEEHLASDFRCILSSGTLLDRATFLENAARPVEMTAFAVEDVSVQFTAATAIIQARTRYTKENGVRGGSRYTDIWVWRDGRWQTLVAHITALDQT